jgi:GT2 family glycosyltransferase
VSERPLPSASVIVCTRDRPDLVAGTVESILAGRLVPAEIVVVDQSEAEHPSLSRDDRVRYVWSRTRGLSRARNIGVATARHELVVFSDDDVRAAPGWLTALLETIAGDEQLVAAGQVLAAEPEGPGRFAASSLVGEVRFVSAGRLNRDPLPGGNMAIHRSAFDVVGTFDERLGAGGRYPAADDNDFGLRLLEAGFRIVFVPEAILYHRAWRPRWFWPVLRWRYGHGKGGFYAKHLGMSERHIKRRLARDIAHRVRRLPRTVVTNPRLAVGDLAYVSGIAFGLTQWFVSERKR